MHVNASDQVLRIDGCRELSGATVRGLLDAVQSAPGPYSTVEINLSEVATMDCRGLGSLISLRNAVRDQARRLRVVNPSAAVERVFHATRATHLFEVVRLDEVAPLHPAGEPGRPPSADEVASLAIQFALPATSADKSVTPHGQEPMVRAS